MPTIEILRGCFSTMSGNSKGLYIVLAVTAFALTGLTIANESNCDRTNYADNLNHGTNHPLGFDRGWLPCIVERETANPYTSSKNEIEQRDLIAQEAMALWAFWVAAFASLTAVITGAGTILIWRQVSLTRKAVEETENAPMTIAGFGIRRSLKTKSTGPSICMMCAARSRPS